MESDKTSTRWFRLLVVGGGGLGAFIYLLYFVGRTSFDAYLSILGIPTGVMNYDFTDYAYFGAQIDNLVIALLFTSIVVGLLSYLFPTEASRSIMPHRKGDLILGLGYLIYFAAALAALAWFILFAPSEVVEPAIFMGILVACMLSVGFSILILYDRALLSRIKAGKIISKLFVAAIAATLICFPYMSATAWGTYKGFVIPFAPDRFPVVELHAVYPLIDGITWEVAGNGSFRNAEELRLVLTNDKYLILKATTDPSSVYIVEIEDVLSAKVIGSEE